MNPLVDWQVARRTIHGTVRQLDFVSADILFQSLLMQMLVCCRCYSPVVEGYAEGFIIAVQTVKRSLPSATRRPIVRSCMGCDKSDTSMWKTR
jgi:hypothetical protein